MMRLLIQLVMLACIATSGVLQAQSAADTGEAVAVPQAEPQPRTPPAGETRKQTAKPAATFNPSERISADSAVSFPVDI